VNRCKGWLINPLRRGGARAHRLQTAAGAGTEPAPGGDKVVNERCITGEPAGGPRWGRGEQTVAKRWQTGERAGDGCCLGCGVRAAATKTLATQRRLGVRTKPGTFLRMLPLFARHQPDVTELDGIAVVLQQERSGRARVAAGKEENRSVGSLFSFSRTLRRRSVHTLRTQAVRGSCIHGGFSPMVSWAVGTCPLSSWKTGDDLEA
jgi:hypothetical protein